MDTLRLLWTSTCICRSSYKWK